MGLLLPRPPVHVHVTQRFVGVWKGAAGNPAEERVISKWDCPGVGNLWLRSEPKNWGRSNVSTDIRPRITPPPPNPPPASLFPTMNSDVIWQVQSTDQPGRLKNGRRPSRRNAK